VDIEEHCNKIVFKVLCHSALSKITTKMLCRFRTEQM
jgi:hypothetical protein